MSKVLRKLKKKSDRTKRVKYKKQKCKFVNEFGDPCKNRAVGKSTLCKKHGGDPIVKSNLISFEDAKELGLSTKFNPAIHPLKFIDLSRQGRSEVEIAAEFGVATKTLSNWAETYTEFATAYEIGQAMHEAWWIQQGKSNLSNNRFNTSLFKFLTGNKLGYSDKMETKNLNMNAHGVLLVPGKMTEDEWEAENMEKAEIINAE